MPATESAEAPGARIGSRVAPRTEHTASRPSSAPATDHDADAVQDWASIPAYRLSASGWERLPAADELEAAMAGSPVVGAEATRERMDRAERALLEVPGARGGDQPPPLPSWDRLRDSEEEDRGPTVRVKIGRLEVAAPPSPPSPPPRPAGGPRLPLHEYLRRRRTGRR